MFKASKKGLPVAIAVALCATAAAGCDFYEGKFKGEFSAGGADPNNFPPAYRGVGYSRQLAASGIITEVGAFANGKAVGHFIFPFGPGQVPTQGYPLPAPTVDPLRVAGPGTDYRKSAGNPTPVPLAYSFDPPGTADPFAPASLCKAPEGYQYDAFADAVRKDQQWNVFTFLPDQYASFPFAALPTWLYRPIVAEVAVGTKDLTCQDVKSDRTLLSYADQGRLDVERAEPEGDGTRFGKPTGRYLAWALIDPGSAVQRVGEVVDGVQGGSVTGTSVQKYGWYDQFIVAYVDGGYIPTEPGPLVNGAPTTRARPQRLYYPRSQVIRTGATAPTNGALGQGYDVVQGDRFSTPDAYSPVCEVFSYALPTATAQEDLPTTEADIIAVAGATIQSPSPTTGTYTTNSAVIPRYVFCLQAAPLPAQSTQP